MDIYSCSVLTVSRDRESRAAGNHKENLAQICSLLVSQRLDFGECGRYMRAGQVDYMLSSTSSL